jgi:hypothetical protein
MALPEGPLPLDPTAKARLAPALSRRRRGIKTGVSRHEPRLARGLFGPSARS